MYRFVGVFGLFNFCYEREYVKVSLIYFFYLIMNFLNNFVLNFLVYSQIVGDIVQGVGSGFIFRNKEQEGLGYNFIIS